MASDRQVWATVVAMAIGAVVAGIALIASDPKFADHRWGYALIAIGAFVAISAIIMLIRSGAAPEGRTEVASYSQRGGQTAAVIQNIELRTSGAEDGSSDSIPPLVLRQRGNEDFSLALHGQAGVSPTTYRVGAGGIELRQQSAKVIRMEKLTCVPQLRFIKANGDWATHASISLEPSEMKDTFAAGSWDYVWRQDSEHGIWSLEGLPATLQRGASIRLPAIMFRVIDPDEAIVCFEQAKRAVLNLRATAYTDIGTFPLEIERGVVMQEPD